MSAAGGDQDVGIDDKIPQALEVAHDCPVGRIATPPSNSWRIKHTEAELWRKKDMLEQRFHA